MVGKSSGKSLQQKQGCSLLCLVKTAASNQSEDPRILVLEGVSETRWVPNIVIHLGSMLKIGITRPGPETE